MGYDIPENPHEGTPKMGQANKTPRSIYGLEEEAIAEDMAKLRKTMGRKLLRFKQDAIKSQKRAEKAEQEYAAAKAWFSDILTEVASGERGICDLEGYDGLGPVPEKYFK